ncbi:MAG: NAD(P)H-dependent oxidoreductase [Capnocytophaga sp.]|nr:NAD(P)H-dependent oxidoreductase [Capnocytophaga sp.]
MNFQAVAQSVTNVKERNVLVISGHPNLKESSANKAILNALEKSYGNSVQFHYLDRLYPDYKIDIKKEQNAVLKADILVLQFPFYWYSTPALLKKWIDDVIFDFFEGNALSGKFKGKKVILSITAGGSEEAYSQSKNKVESYLLPLQETFEVIGGKWQKPLFLFSAMPSAELEKATQNYAKELIKAIEKHR